MKVACIQLEYLETGWSARTYDCIRADGLEVVAVARREGVGSMSAAFNRAAREVLARRKSNLKGGPDFIWFLTNVTFRPGTAKALVDAFDGQTAAVHPQFASDHGHIANPRGVQDVPFVEWTAPMLRVSALEQIGMLDEAMPYVGMDLDWSYRAKQAGWKLRATNRAQVAHKYLRHNAPEEISRIRERLRALYAHPTDARMVEKYGTYWKEMLWETHPAAKKTNANVF